VFRASNCSTTYAGYEFGYFSFYCGGWIPGLALEESLDAEQDRERALDYVSDHTRDLPRVVAARVARVWDVFHPLQNAKFSTVEGRPRRVTQAGLLGWWLVAPLGVAGAVVLYRRRVTLVPVVAQVVLVTFTAAIAYGGVRFRIPAEVAFVALAGVAVDAGWSALAARRSPSRVPDPVPARHEEAAALS
jgi:hypothetical protein